MTPSTPPAKVPTNPRFCSGPCAKHPGWSFDQLDDRILSRGHRSPFGTQFIRSLLDRTRKLLNIPGTHHLMFTPGSATGAITMAMWNFLGSRPVDIIANDVFSHRWAQDAIDLGLRVRVHKSEYGGDPKTNDIDASHDVLFVWCGTSTGTTIADVEWIPKNHRGLTLCDATSAAFCTPLPWERLDLTCFSLQKGMGGEAGIGVLVVSDQALKHLETYAPTWPVPYVFNLKQNGSIRVDLFEGGVINTPSLMGLSDYGSALTWAETGGGASFLFDRVLANRKVLDDWISENQNVQYFVSTPKFRSVSATCFQVRKEGALLERGDCQKITQTLSERGVAYDILGFGGLSPMLRVWTGPTIESEDLKILTEWLTWAIGSMGK